MIGAWFFVAGRSKTLFLSPQPLARRLKSHGPENGKPAVQGQAGSGLPHPVHPVPFTLHISLETESFVLLSSFFLYYLHPYSVLNTLISQSRFRFNPSILRSNYFKRRKPVL
jgi:hypothetical protein